MQKGFVSAMLNSPTFSLAIIWKYSSATLPESLLLYRITKREYERLLQRICSWKCVNSSSCWIILTLDQRSIRELFMHLTGTGTSVQSSSSNTLTRLTIPTFRKFRTTRSEQPSPTCTRNIAGLRCWNNDPECIFHLIMIEQQYISH